MGPSTILRGPCPQHTCSSQCFSATDIFQYLLSSNTYMDDIFLQTQDAYELHTQAQASLAASRTPLRDYLRSRGSRMMVAIRGLGGGGTSQSIGDDLPVM